MIVLLATTEIIAATHINHVGMIVIPALMVLIVPHVISLIITDRSTAALSDAILQKDTTKVEL